MGSSKSWLARSRALISIILLVPAGLAVATATPPFPVDSWQALCFEAAGWTLFFAGAIFRWWATLYIGGRKGTQLACHGPYSMTRNPLYFGTFLMVLSVGIFAESGIFVVASLPVAVLYLAIVVPGEERRLSSRFGREYEKYRARVPMFFPRVSLYQRLETIRVNSEGLRAELLRSIRWACIPILCHLYLYLRL
ncbi:MAG: methyltransferase family protein [Planctomycetaceae bacterium]